MCSYFNSTDLLNSRTSLTFTGDVSYHLFAIYYHFNRKRMLQHFSNISNPAWQFRFSVQTSWGQCCIQFGVIIPTIWGYFYNWSCGAVHDEIRKPEPRDKQFITEMLESGCISCNHGSQRIALWPITREQEAYSTKKREMERRRRKSWRKLLTITLRSLIIVSNKGRSF